MKNIILYGILGADQQYRVARYWMIHTDSLNSGSNLISLMKFQAKEMVDYYPSIQYVYAISSRPGLLKEYVESYKTNSIESCAIFKDILEREGIRII